MFILQMGKPELERENNLPSITQGESINQLLFTPLFNKPKVSRQDIYNYSHCKEKEPEVHRCEG